MTAPQTYVVQSDFTLTWDHEQTLVHARSLVDLVPGSALYAAYGGSSNLALLPAGQTGDAADHSTTQD
jgi:hypothetical protein